MPKPYFLVCFDAFGTLFTPRRPIAQQYGEVARSLGLGGFTDEELNKSFYKAFKHEAKQNPNYGKANNLGAEKWWTNVIHNTFKPLAGANHPLPSELAPKLIHRFRSDEGFTLYPDVRPFLEKLRSHIQRRNGQLVVGVITNSDDRVPSVLSSLGMSVGPLRFGSTASPDYRAAEHDIDFTIISYDVGHEKPDRRIFEAADETMDLLLSSGGDGSQRSESFRKIYVGDEYSKDITGALNAGWNAVLIDRDPKDEHPGLLWLDDQEPANFLEIFERSRAVGSSSLERLTKWIPEDHC